VSRARSSHFDAAGRARMIDVGAKGSTRREAVARGRVLLSRAALDAVASGAAKKGDVLGVARIAGIQAAKRTADWIPLAHPLALESIEIDFEPSSSGEEPAIEIEARVRITGKTGVEMEALVAVSAAALAIYDMCKSIDRSMRIDAIRLESKRGGKSGDYRRAEAARRRARR
jgi:cyclic pyranopterin phosphate synthase